jgi:hypothetical protein
MKPILAKLTLIAAALFGATHPLAAQTALPGSVASVNLALKRSFTAPGVMKKDSNGKPIKNGQMVFANSWVVDFPQFNLQDVNVEFAGIAKTEKYSTREFLLDLIALEVLPQKGIAPFIAGWSIQRAAATLPQPPLATNVPELSDTRIFAKHNDGTLINISAILKFITGPSAESYKQSTVLVYDTFMGSSLSRAIHKSTEKVKTCEFVEIDFRPLTPEDEGEYSLVNYAWLQGIRATGNTLGTVGKAKTPVIGLAASKTSGISGYGFEFSYVNGENGPDPYDAIGVFEGSISSPAGAKLEDVSTYFPDLVMP